MEKMIIDGKVAVLYSPGFGAGWSTWAHENEEAMVFDSRIVKHVLAGDFEKAGEVAEKLYPGNCVDGAKQLNVMWLPVGTQFEITEYDGYENVENLSEKLYLIA